MAVRRPVPEVGKIIGGNVQKNIEMAEGGFANACPIRMSYVLNKTGFPVRQVARLATVSGADHQQYLFRVNDIMEYMRLAFGKPDKVVKSPTPADFAGMKGIIVVKGHGWNNARGHVTLWNGSQCSDSCHLLDDPDNGRFVPETAAIWVLQ